MLIKRMPSQWPCRGSLIAARQSVYHYVISRGQLLCHQRVISDREFVDDTYRIESCLFFTDLLISLICQTPEISWGLRSHLFISPKDLTAKIYENLLFTT